MRINKVVDAHLHTCDGYEDSIYNNLVWSVWAGESNKVKETIDILNSQDWITNVIEYNSQLPLYIEIDPRYTEYNGQEFIKQDIIKSIKELFDANK